MRLNKRGQEGSPMGTIIGVVILIIFLVIVGIFLFTGKQKGEDVVNLLPSAATLKIAACDELVEINTRAALCVQFTEAKLVSGEISFINCLYSPIFDNLDDETQKKIKEACDDEKDHAKRYCAQLTPEQEEERFVNGEKCSEWIGGTQIDDGGLEVTVEEQCLADGGEFISEKDCAETGKTNTGAFNEEGNICCILS